MELVVVSNRNLDKATSARAQASIGHTAHKNDDKLRVCENVRESRIGLVKSA
jgi:hypothetical protein